MRLNFKVVKSFWIETLLHCLFKEVVAQKVYFSTWLVFISGGSEQNYFNQAPGNPDNKQMSCISLGEGCDHNE